MTPAAFCPRRLPARFSSVTEPSAGTVLCRAHFLPDLEMMSQVDAGRRGSLENYGNVYEAQVFVSDGKVELLKKSATLEVAPVEGQRQRSGVPSRPSRPRP